MKNYIQYFIILTVSFASGCGKEINYNYSDIDAPAPLPVSDIKITPTAGGGIITYKLPADENLQYVKAVFELKPGTASEVKASAFSDSLMINGFGNVSERQIKIFSVGKNGKTSEPVVLTLKPLMPVVNSVFSTLAMEPAFGGVKVRFGKIYPTFYGKQQQWYLLLPPGRIWCNRILIVGFPHLVGDSTKVVLCFPQRVCESAKQRTHLALPLRPWISLARCG